ncbi:MAG: hypothetical protein Q7S51_11865 [Gallionellaceae bacterium]|nr:hypothetical protein [Gallionellaceae bacterium]
MSIIKKAIIPAMLGLAASGLTANLSHATTLSDLQSQCFQACHDVVVLPSNWVLSLNAVGIPAGGSKSGDHDLAGWNSTIAAMGDGKCGFNNVGPGGTSRSVAAQFLFDKRATAATPTATATTAPTPTATATTAPTPTATATTAPTPTATSTSAPTPTSIGPTPTSTTAPTPTATSTTAPTPTATSTTAPTPTATSTTAPTPTATATTPPVGTHTWYDYDYKGGRCFAKDHTIMDSKWCEQHGYKGGGGHNGLTAWDFKLHAHLDFPGQKP